MIIAAIHTGVLILIGVNSLLLSRAPQGRKKAVELVLHHKLRNDCCPCSALSGTCFIRIARFSVGRQAEAARGYCLAMRSALTDDGRAPLEASGLKLQERLTLISDSLARVSQKKTFRQY
jgi:hypothetical protein